jgi:hypothetical protein
LTIHWVIVGLYRAIFIESLRDLIISILRPSKYKNDGGLAAGMGGLPETLCASGGTDWAGKTVERVEGEPFWGLHRRPEALNSSIPRVSG